jgi:hypothetical protein
MAGTFSALFGCGHKLKDKMKEVIATFSFIMKRWK